MSTKTQTETKLSPVCDFESTIMRLTSVIGGPLGGPTEALWNSHERGQAKNIQLFVTGKGSNYELVIVDDGIGMTMDRLNRFVSAGVTDTNQTGRNYQDLGTKRFAADFKYCEIMTISQEDMKSDPGGMIMKRVQLDWDELIKVLAGKSQKEIQCRNLKPDWKAMRLPNGSTGTYIRLYGSRENSSRPTADKLRSALPQIIPPAILEKTALNGEPLPKRVIAGEPFRMSVSHPKLGRVSIDLYIPNKISAQDRLMVGPYEGVCDWRSFVRELDDSETVEQLDVLSNGVFGLILVEGFKTFVGASRREFDPSLYSHPLMKTLLDFLVAEVVPPLEERLGLIKEKWLSAKDKALLDEIALYTGLIETETDIRPSVLELDPSNLELLPGSDPVKIEVVKFNPSRTIKWDVSRSGGKAAFKDENRVLDFSPGKEVGEYVLTASYAEEPDVRASVRILIVPRKILRISPARVTVAPGRTIRLKAINAEDCSSGAENLRWRLSNEDPEGRFLVTLSGGRVVEKTTGYGECAVYQAGSKTGTFRIELFDASNRRNVAQCDVTVEKPSKSEGGSRKGSPVVRLRGYEYVLNFVRMEKLPEIAKSFRKGDFRQVSINRSHPAVKHAENLRGNAGLVELALNQLILQHVADYAEDEGESLDPRSAARKVAELYAEMVSAYEKRKAGKR